MNLSLRIFTYLCYNYLPNDQNHDVQRNSGYFFSIVTIGTYLRSYQSWSPLRPARGFLTLRKRLRENRQLNLVMGMTLGENFD